MKKTRFDQLLSDQIGNEFAASQHYIAIAVWFDNRDLPSSRSTSTVSRSRSAITP